MVMPESALSKSYADQQAMLRAAQPNARSMWRETVIRLAAYRKFGRRRRQAAPGRSATGEGGGRDRPEGLHLRLLGDIHSVIDLDAEIPDDAFELMDRSPKRDPCHRLALESPFRHGILHAQDRWRRVVS
jgi:hypothetical protein